MPMLISFATDFSDLFRLPGEIRTVPNGYIVVRNGSRSDSGFGVVPQKLAIAVWGGPLRLGLAAAVR